MILFVIGALILTAVNTADSRRVQNTTTKEIVERGQSDRR